MTIRAIKKDGRWVSVWPRHVLGSLPDGQMGDMEDAEIDVCQNCGAYFEWRRGLIGQRCERCSKL